MIIIKVEEEGRMWSGLLVLLESLVKAASRLQTSWRIDAKYRRIQFATEGSPANSDG